MLFIIVKDENMRVSGVVSNSNIYNSKTKRRIGLKNNSEQIRDQYIHSDISAMQTYNKPVIRCLL